MPVRLDGTTSDYISLSTPGFPSVTAYTLIFWMQVVNANAGTNRTFYVCAGGGSEQRLWRPASNNDNVAINFVSGLDLSSNDDESSWQMWAFVVAGTGSNQGSAYRWKSGDADGTYGSATFTANAFTPADILLGGTYYSTGRDARLAFVKVWDAALSLAELQAERATGKPVRTTNVNRYHRLETATDTSDGSGNGRTCTIAGAVTEGTEPVLWEAVSVIQNFQYDWPHQLHARR
jgi:hypothetical protein